MDVATQKDGIIGGVPSSSSDYNELGLGVTAA